MLSFRKAANVATMNSKNKMHDIGGKVLGDLSRHTPSPLLSMGGALTNQIGFGGNTPGARISNLAISNFPGPNVPLYLQGAKLEYWSVAGPRS